MDRISLLSDDLLLKILSYARTKDVLDTSLLSKRWTSLWKHVPKIDLYVDLMDSGNRDDLRFVNKFLESHKAPVLETLYFNILTTYNNPVPQVEIEKWIRVVISRSVRDLRLSQTQRGSRPVPLPRSLFACQSLVNLHLRQVKIVDVPSDISFPSLKQLSLSLANFSSGEVFSIMLSSCPVLEELFMDGPWDHGGVKTITIAVPWLQRLDISETSDCDRNWFMVNTPSLKSLKTYMRNSQFFSLVKMPELVKAEIDVKHGDPERLLSCLTSAKHLTLCLNPRMDYNPPYDFNQLVSLELSTRCTSYWLIHILRHCPNLRTLRFRQFYCRNTRYIQIKWEQPSFVPKCLISSLETVEWIVYGGTEAEKEVAIYLLGNASYLNKMTIKTNSTLKEKNRLRMEFESKPRSSSKCLISIN
ncbi:PREDICTED: putative FBD-associated F-box protein At5g56440 [Camelina sativa]|uniref:FBD-associated F-box protein At5g56440 n=1 Tax=Camelina sativa TaxID=90675 RepID=A0ABM0WVA0_CAMSA|nr:PREDICTED: putative FBD-associated F-box protein At5g56440 [Camelina sativa]